MTFSTNARKKLKEIEELKGLRQSETYRSLTLKKIEDGSFAKEFNEWVKEYGRTERDIKVVCEPWIEDWNLINGDLRIGEVVIGGAAQVYKSLGSYLLAFYATEKGYLNILYTFAKALIRNKIVASTVFPFRDNNKAATPGSQKPITENTQLYSTENYTSYWSFVNNGGAENDVSVPAELASISVDVILMDEYSQYDPVIAGVLRNRQSNSSLESRPVRYVSTPGRSGTGIDAQLKQCSHVFTAHVECTHCQKLASLDPLACFLRQGNVVDSTGAEILSYFDTEMKAVDWYHEDPEDRVNSAYLACEHCGGKLPQNILKTSRLYDKETKVSVSDFLEIVQQDPFKIRKVGLVASPFLRRVKSNVAARYANDAIQTENPLDYIQQGLGMATNDEFGGLTPEQLLPLILAPKEPANPKEYEMVRLLGMDVARSSHYLTSMNCYIPKIGSKEDKYRNTIRVVSGFDRVASHAFSEFHRKGKYAGGAIDFQPDASLSLELSSKFGLQIMSQKHNLRELFREDKELEAGGISTSGYSFNNQYFLNMLIKGLRSKSGDELLYRLPSNLLPQVRHITKAGVIGHFVNMTYNEDKSMWEKGKANRSDWFYSLLFAEVALYWYIFSKQDHSWLKFF
jgi:hypothetical protein